MLTTRELNEQQAVTLCEQIGDTPVFGIFEAEQESPICVVIGDEKLAADLAYKLQVVSQIPTLSFTYACPTCGDEVDVRETEAI